MMEFGPLGFAGLLMEMQHGLSHAHQAALKKAAVIIETEAKRVIGTYDYGWQQLAAATKEDRVSQGYSENEPGYRSGEMRDSIQHTVLTREAHIGSDDDKLVWFELGTETQPARPVLYGAAVHKAKEVERVIGRAMYGYLANGGKLVDDF